VSNLTGHLSTAATNLHLIRFTTQHFRRCGSFTQKQSKWVLLEAHVSYSSSSLASLFAGVNKHKNLTSHSIDSFNSWFIFPELLQVTAVPQSKLPRIVVAVLHALPDKQTTNSIEAEKDDSVPDRRQCVATMLPWWAGTLQWLYGLHCPSASREHPSCYYDSAHAATVPSRWARNISNHSDSNPTTFSRSARSLLS